MPTAIDSLRGFEVHVGRGLPGFAIVGVRDEACRAWRDDVRAMALSMGFDWPMTRITVQLRKVAAADVPLRPSQDDARTLAVLVANAAGVNHPSWAELVALPVLSSGHTTDLRAEGDIPGSRFTRYRLFTSRGGVADGEPFEHTVYVEALDPATTTWTPFGHYDGDRPGSSNWALSAGLRAMVAAATPCPNAGRYAGVRIFTNLGARTQCPTCGRIWREPTHLAMAGGDPNKGATPDYIPSHTRANATWEQPKPGTQQVIGDDQ